MGRVDDAIAIAQEPDVIMTAFGDMMRVPGGDGSFFDAKAAGADIRMVYSPLDALKIARNNPDKHVVFMAIGFETTAPSTAMTVLRAAREGIENFSIFCNHVTIIPAIKAILDSPDLRLDGFLGPGHVSTVIGCRPYEFIAARHGKPLVTAGFEPLDILQSVHQLMLQLREGRCEVENQYSRVVPWDGNRRALEVIGEVMELRPYFEWRGLGFISQSAMQMREEYARFDAERIFQVPGVRVADPKACQCGEVLKGVLEPWECKVFGTACTPETPIGTCMVSSEGACAAYYNFGRFSRERVRAGGTTDARGPGGGAAMTSTQNGGTPSTPAGPRRPWRRTPGPSTCAARSRCSSASSGRGGASRGCARSGSRSPTAPGARRRTRSSTRCSSRRSATRVLEQLEDGASLEVGGARLAFTTDSYVVSPLFFPGGDIGDLAVNGTVNDLAMCGARPLHLSAGFILEEGFPVADLRRIVASMARAAAAAGVQIVTGDTKVVPRGKADGCFITTAGVGVLERPVTLSAAAARPGDAVIVSGPARRPRHHDHAGPRRARHRGRPVLGHRRRCTSSPPACSTPAATACGCCATRPAAGSPPSSTRSRPRRRSRSWSTRRRCPVREVVTGASELLGIDPLYVACEGRLVAVVDAARADAVMAALRAHPLGDGAAVDRARRRRPARAGAPAHRASAAPASSTCSSAIPYRASADLVSACRAWARRHMRPRPRRPT